MKTILVTQMLLLLLLLASFSVFAGDDIKGYIARSPDGTVTVILREAFCTSPKMVALLTSFGVPAAVIAKLRTAEVTFDKKVLEACYAVEGATVELIAEDGNRGPIPVSEFKPTNEV